MPTPKTNLLLLSGSKAAGGLPEGQKPGMLDFAEPWIRDFFAKAIADHKPILFVPYARPSGITEQEYFTTVHDRLAKMGIDVVCALPEGLTEKDFKNIGGIYVGGGHTYTLLNKLQQNGALDLIRKHVADGLPYMGASAGTIITCPTIKTTNDMPGPANDIIDTHSLGLINTQLNCHYRDDSMEDPKHQGETRDTRLKEFCAFNPDKTVLGLYEGQALRIEGDKATLLTSPNARGTKPPVFVNKERKEISCTIGVPTDVSKLVVGAHNSAAPKARGPSPR